MDLSNLDSFLKQEVTLTDQVISLASEIIFYRGSMRRTKLAQVIVKYKPEIFGYTSDDLNDKEKYTDAHSKCATILTAASSKHLILSRSSTRLSHGDVHSSASIISITEVTRRVLEKNNYGSK